MRILVIEDEKAIAEPLAHFLRSKKFAVDTAFSCEEAQAQIDVNEYDCLLLDVNLPDKNGVEFAQELRAAQFTTPIIMLTARYQTHDKILGLNSGADDYITKPFDMDELVARVKAQIRSHSKNISVDLTIGGYTLVPDENALYLNDARVELSNKECAVLEYLCRHKGKIVSAEELLEHVWDENVNPFSQSLKTHIKTLRAKIDPDHVLIKTIRGKGYKIENE